MKMKFLSPCGVILIQLFLSYSLISQPTTFNLTRTITFNDNSNTEVIVIPVDKPITNLTMSVISMITKGNLSVEIYDPIGTKIGNYSVGTQLKDPEKKDETSTLSGGDREKMEYLLKKLNHEARRTETVQGHINKSFENPQKGDWTVKLISTKATGKVTIHSSFLEMPSN